MRIMQVPFEEPIIIQVGNEMVQLVAFKTQEHGNIKFGVNASRSVNIHREEIYNAIKAKETKTG
jgi:carbon storage regulator